MKSFRSNSIIQNSFDGISYRVFENEVLMNDFRWKSLIVTSFSLRLCSSSPWDASNVIRFHSNQNSLLWVNACEATQLFSSLLFHQAKTKFQIKIFVKRHSFDKLSFWNFRQKILQPSTVVKSVLIDYISLNKHRYHYRHLNSISFS